MSGFLIARDGDHFVVSSSGPLDNYIIGDEGMNLNNSPIIVINNDYGKVVVVYPRCARLCQLLRSNASSLFKHTEHIDYNYIKYVFFPKYVKLIGEETNINNKDDRHKRPAIACPIGIIAEDKAYFLREDGYIKEQDYIGSTPSLEAHLFAMKDDYEHHDTKFLNRVLMYDHIKIYELLYGMFNLSTSDYEQSYVSAIKEEMLYDSNSCN